MAKRHGISASVLASLAALTLHCAAQQNPWNGSWKADRSTFKYDGPTFAISTDADGFTIMRSGEAGFKVVCDGKAIQHPNGSSTTCRQSAVGYELENTRDGKPVSREKLEITPDGKTVTRIHDVMAPGVIPFTVTATSMRISGGPGLSGTWKEAAIRTSRDTGVLSIQITVTASTSRRRTTTSQPPVSSMALRQPLRGRRL